MDVDSLILLWVVLALNSVLTVTVLALFDHI